MRKMLVRVTKIQFHKDLEQYYVFSGTVYKIDKKTGLRKPTTEKVTCTGLFRSLYEGDLFELDAIKYEHKLYGEQYKIIISNRVDPGTIEEIPKFMIQRCKGLGPTKAKAITDKYGLDTLQKIAKDISALDCINLKVGEKLHLQSEIVDNLAFEDLLMFLNIHHIDSVYSTILYKKYGVDSVSVLTDNPYTPYLDNLWAYRYSENLHFSLGRPYNTPERKHYLVLAAIHWDSENGGNLYIPKDIVKATVERFQRAIHSPYLKDKSLTEEDVEESLEMLERFSMILRDNTTTTPSIYLAFNYANENRIANELERLSNGTKVTFFVPKTISDFLEDYEKRTGIELAYEQRQGVISALTSSVSVITGGPGTGKTHTIRTIIACAKELEPGVNIKVCAPTGKAAVRASEMSGLPATTIHRMLQLFNPTAHVGAEELNCDILIADEFSMVDAYLCSRTFIAAASHTRIIMVGDYNQLPSVGPGLVLRDFIRSGKIPTVKLTTVFRQAKMSRIVRNSYAIINQKAGEPINLHFAKKPKDDFYFIEAESISDIRKTIQRSVHRLKNKYGYNLSDIQILTPVRKTPLGADSLNLLFQEEFLPAATTPSVEILDREFRLGDKVIHTKNNSELGVYNGEVGFVKRLNFLPENMLTVSYSTEKSVNYTLSELEDLDLAYGLTVHKSQGSEFPVVIIPVHETILHGLNKNLIYTALTRAKKMVILIGSKSALSAGMRNEENIGERRSMLVRKIQDLL